MKRTGKLLSAALGGTLMFTGMGVLAGCGKGTGSAQENNYQVWLYTGQDTAYYSDYADNPVLQYLLQETWNEKNISFEFLVPAAGQGQNNYQTMISGNDLPTLMQDSVADPAPVMYENGYIMDITEYVQSYMPNYYNLLQNNETLKAKSVFHVDGEDRILSLNTLKDAVSYVDFGGMCYRRDWIVNYGTDASTGEKFSGGYTDENEVDSWQDNVIFPSWYDTAKKEKALAIDPAWDGTEPFYLSDWEWMFGIFETAQKALGIEDSYCMSMYYPGYTWAGGLCSCFGEGGIIWYADEQGKIQFGGASESTRAYLTCMNAWYEKGWLDQTFNERVNDVYYQIDSSSVRQGKVGMWCGVKGDLGGRMDLKDGGNTSGIYVAGCAYPVNDIYGDDSCKYKQPRVMNVDTSLLSTGFFVMSGADKKDLPTLFTFLDYLYTEEGGAMRTFGLNKEQLSGLEDPSFYQSYHLEDGAYSVNQDGKYVVNEAIRNDSGSLSVAASLDKLPGLSLVKNVEYGYSAALEKSLQSWIKYRNQGRVWGSTAMLNMSPADSETAQKALTKVLNYLESNTFRFINGAKDIEDDSAWRN